MIHLQFTPGPWWLDPLDDPERYDLARGVCYQVMAEVAGTAATITTIEEYNEVATPIHRAADAALIAMAPIRATTPYDKHPDLP